MDPVTDVNVSGPFLSDPDVQRVLRVLNANGEEALIVGGAVRNALMRRAIADVDIATTAVPEESCKRLADAGFRIVPTGITHGTILAVRDGQSFEVTTLREDIKTDGRHAVVAFGRSWSADAARRDFTMNALYCDANGRIYDPVGGVRDCLAGVVRFIGDPDQRLREDYLRLMRFFRFWAQYGGDDPDPAGLAACARAHDGLRRISAERIAQESRKLLLSTNASGPCRMFATSGLGQPAYTVAPNPAVFANVGELARSHRQPLHFETALAAFTCYSRSDADRLAERLRLSNAEHADLQVVCRLGLDAWHDGPPDLQAVTHTMVECGKLLVVQGLLLVGARFGASSDNGRLDQLFSHIESFDLPVFPLRGRDLTDLGIEAGPDIGDLLRRARAVWRDEGYCLSRDRLLERIQDWIVREKTSPSGH